MSTMGRRMASASIAIMASALLMAAPAAAQVVRTTSTEATERPPVLDCTHASADARCGDAQGRTVRPQRQQTPTESRPAPDQLGGGDPGWEARVEPDLLGGGDPGWEARVEANQLGGGDPGWEDKIETNELGGGDPGWENRIRQTVVPAQTNAPFATEAEVKPQGPRNSPAGHGSGNQNRGG